MEIKHKILLLFILFPFFTFASIGLADWQNETPHGNHIDNFNGSGYTLQLNVAYDKDMQLAYNARPQNKTYMLESLKEWYFYNESIVGRLETPDKNYFVVNEISGNVMLFDTEKQWQEYLKKNDLIPVLWTRWYNGSWIFLGDDFLFFMAIGFIVTVPLFIGYLILLYNAIFREKFNLKKPLTQLVLLITIPIFIFWSIDLSPQSI
jgi:hypothetical protein